MALYVEQHGLYTWKVGPPEAAQGEVAKTKWVDVARGVTQGAADLGRGHVEAKPGKPQKIVTLPETPSPEKKLRPTNILASPIMRDPIGEDLETALVPGEMIHWWLAWAPRTSPPCNA